MSTRVSDTRFDHLKRIESILRNGLPHNDGDVVGTIAHSHAEVELLLESIDEHRWAQ